MNTLISFCHFNNCIATNQMRDDTARKANKRSLLISHETTLRSFLISFKKIVILHLLYLIFFHCYSYWFFSCKYEVEEARAYFVTNWDRPFVCFPCSSILNLIGGYTIDMSKWNQSVHTFLTRSVRLSCRHLIAQHRKLYWFSCKLK